MIPTQQPERTTILPRCPECGSTTFWNNTDGYQMLFCINDDCKWKQQIRSRPAPSPDNIRKAIDELEYSLRAGSQEEIDCHIREALDLLKEIAP
jgi:hypothetical protein